VSLELRDHAIIGGMIAAARLGGFLLTSRYVQRLTAWARLEVAQLHEHAQWATHAIQAIAESVHAHLPSAPNTRRFTPPPVPTGLRAVVDEVTDHGRGEP
jgi:hypothetical protein